MKISSIFRLLVVFLIGMAFLPSAAPVSALGSLIYVSTAGNDTTGNGSINKPFKTIGRALTQAASGDEIVLRGAPALVDNRYEEDVRIEAPNITLRSQTGEWAVIECPVNDEDITECVRFDVDSSGSSVKNVEIIGGYYYGIMLYTRWDWGDPDDRSGASDILIEDAVIHDTGRDAIKITPGCDDVTINRVEIYNTGVRDNSNAEGIDNVNGDRMIVQDSYIHDIATTGIYFKGGAIGGVVQRNRIERVGEAGILIGFDTSPEFFDLTVNPNYYENIGGIVRNNVVIDSQYSGIGLYAAKNAQVINNTLINTAQTGHSPIYFGVTYQDWDENAGRPPSINPTIKNNLVSQPSDQSGECIFIRYSDDLGGLSGLSGAPDMDYNLYYHAGSACQFTDQRPNSYMETGSFSQWKSHIGGDAHSLATNPQIAADGSLPAGSPAVNAGTNASCPTPDQRKTPRPQGAACDIGALERASIVTFRSVAAQDGWTLESAEDSSTGGSFNHNATSLNVGDDASDRQYRGFLSFDTSTLPDNAVITKVTLKIRFLSAVGADAFASHGSLTVDVRRGVFGLAADLVAGDFQAAATKNAVGTMPSTRVGGWHTRVWTSGILAYINKTGPTQFRLRFTAGDNDDSGADYIRFYSGNDATASYRPSLVIEYHVP